MFGVPSSVVYRTAGVPAGGSVFSKDGPEMNLRTSIILAVVSGLLIPVSLSTGFTMLRQEQVLAEQFADDHRGLADLLAIGMQTPLWNLSTDEGRPLFDSVMSDERVVSVLVADNKAGPFLFREHPERRAGTQLLQQRPIFHEEEAIGEVTIEMDTSRLDAAVSNYRTIFVLTVLGQLLLSLLLIIKLLQVRVLSPLRRLMRQSRFLVRREETTPFIWKRKDEIGSLGRTLEDTRQALQALFRELEEKNHALQDDIERRSRIEGELKRHRDHLEELVAQRTAALAQRSDELARSNADLEQFAYVASHDLQEPLRMVSSYLQLLEKRYKDKLDQDATTFIGFAVDGAVRMQNLINDLLTYSRVGSKGAPFQPVDCAQVMEMVLHALQVNITDSQGQVSVDRLPVVMGDAMQLTQLFQNLLANALKFRGESPPCVHVSAERNGACWVFSVADNGIGIAPEYFNRIFVMFQRLHGRRAYSGTGIGLAICKKIVERHGGSIWVESMPGEGANFKFTIPAIPEAPAIGEEKGSHG